MISKIHQISSTSYCIRASHREYIKNEEEEEEEEKPNRKRKRSTIKLIM
jgi:hypothetical protein